MDEVSGPSINEVLVDVEMYARVVVEEIDKELVVDSEAVVPVEEDKNESKGEVVVLDVEVVLPNGGNGKTGVVVA